jgi:uncharacterized HAD superfamily protein
MNSDFLPDEDDGNGGDVKSKKYEDFLLAEYGSITQAYFNTTTTIATFFRNYLVIVGLPIPIFAFLLTQLSRGGNLPTIPEDLSPFIPGLACMIGMLGLFVMLYVVNLRLDALLYARAVNGIRKHFYDRSGTEYPEELRLRVLPRSIHQPRYFEWHYFLSVIAVFAMLNTLYPIIGFVWYQNHYSTTAFWMIWTSLGIGITCVAIHLFAYWWLTWYRDNKYLRKYIIGVDIDGVLNKHRDHFCYMVWFLYNKSIWADQITCIPVRDCKALNVTQAEEETVFNQPLYWNELPPLEGAAEALRKLKNTFGFKIYIFTHRPFPEPGQYPPAERERYEQLWKCQRIWNPVGLNLIRALRRYWDPLRFGIMRTLTENWLRQHGFEYHKLYIEAGNVHTTDRRIKVRNRFTISERKEIRIFVEDDLFKARKLASICEVVFLIDHPYNQADDLPKNMIRVRSWKEIYEFIRQEL